MKRKETEIKNEGKNLICMAKKKKKMDYVNSYRHEPSNNLPIYLRFTIE